MYRVYVTRALPDEVVKALAGRCDVRVWDGDGPVPDDVLRREMSDVEGLLCMLTDTIDSSLLVSAPNLRVVSQMAVGVDNIDVDVCAKRGIAIGHTPGVLTETVADTAWALLGSIVRRLPEGERVVKAGGWRPWSPFEMTGGDLHSSTLGIVGMGRIGQSVSRRATGFDMSVVYSSPSSKPDVVAVRLSLPELLAEADHVVVCAALTEETRGLIGRSQLQQMKPSAYLVNVGRGPLVETAALVEALQWGWIAGAGLDVTDPEPLPPDHALLAFPNCLVVPHIASASVRTRTAMAMMSVDNLIAGLEGGAMPAEYSAHFHDTQGET